MIVIVVRINADKYGTLMGHIYGIIGTQPASSVSWAVLSDDDAVYVTIGRGRYTGRKGGMVRWW